VAFSVARRAQFTLGTNHFEIDYGVGSDGNDAVLRAVPGRA
jgi:hypothetical protein